VTYSGDVEGAALGTPLPPSPEASCSERKFV
jgi:hypothetical protein